MLIAYLDEFGHQGPYISHSHPKFKTHPAFGYAGYVLPAENVRKFGGYFEHIKENLLQWEIQQAEAHPRRWEKKGAALLTTSNNHKYGGEIRPALNRIYRRLGELNGEIFFYGQQKPIGPLSVTKESSQDRENHCLIQSINRLGTYAAQAGKRLLVIMDATDTDNRERAVATLGKTIYDRSNKDNRSIIEVPLQADSRLYGTLQLADWTCALIGRLADYHFAEDSEFSWAVDLGRSIFTKAQPTSRSVIWSNSPAKDSRCFPNHLIQAERFREIEARNEQRYK